MADLTTLAAVREYLKVEVGDTEDDALLSALVTRLSGLTEDFLGRTLPSARGTNPVTEHLNGQNTPFVQLKLYPAADTTSVKQSLDQDWGAADELLTEVILDEVNGIVKLKTGIFFAGFRNVQVIHDHSEVLLLGLEQKVIEMVAKAYQEKDNLGVVSLSLKDGSMTKKLQVGAIFEGMKKELAPYGNPSGVL
jgi:hypothetical protein